MTVTLCDRCGKKIVPTNVYSYIYADDKCINPKNEFVLKRYRYASSIAREEDIDLCAECDNELNALLNEFFKEED